MERRGFFARMVGAVAGLFGVPVVAFSSVDRPRSGWVGSELYFRGNFLDVLMLSPLTKISPEEAGNVDKLSSAILQAKQIIARESAAQVLTSSQHLAAEQAKRTLMRVYLAMGSNCVKYPDPVYSLDAQRPTHLPA